MCPKYILVIPLSFTTSNRTLLITRYVNRVSYYNFPLVISMKKPTTELYFFPFCFRGSSVSTYSSSESPTNIPTLLHIRFTSNFLIMLVKSLNHSDKLCSLSKIRTINHKPMFRGYYQKAALSLWFQTFEQIITIFFN